MEDGMDVEVILYIVLGFLLLMVVLVVPFLYQLWRTVRELSVTLSSLNERLPSILKNIEELTGNMNEASRNVNARVTELSFAFQRAQAFLNTVQGFEQLLRSRVGFPLVRVLQNLMPLLKGTQAFCRTLGTGSKSRD